MMSEPTRLLDDPASAEGLRADLVQAQSVVLKGLDLSAGAAGLKAAIAAETTAAGAGAGKALGLGLAGAATAGVLVWFALRAPEPDPKPVAVAPVVSAQGPVEPAAPLDPQPRIVEPEAVVVPSIAEPAAVIFPSVVTPEVSAPKVVPVVRRRARRASKQDDYLREARLISDARAAMKTDAGEALERLAEARSEFPRGLLREEREALTILSLEKLGRSSQANAAAKRFLETHGDGPYAEAVRQVLDERPSSR
ncbi:MAG: hypothetical protein KUG77_00325 [Nannocystaceae bacterium]|nr:hypothetical protein [Nannocystaceae bacterium]